MKLHRMRIEQVRQFRQPLEICDLEPGINLFTGPNESGKSTLVRAIRAAFFERHKSSSVEDLQPWGDSSAAPGIQLEFDWQDKRWRLAKSFLRQKRCDLQVGGQSFNGDEAEERLAELLGYQFPGRGASKAEHWGIPGLLWIEQGSGQNIHDAVAYAGDHLKSALGESLGEVASSAGDELIARVERERAVLLTSTGRPTGDYARINQQYDEYRARLDELDASISTYRQQVDRLGELRQQQQEDATKPWQDYRRQAKEAEDCLAEVEGWVREQQREQKELQHCLDSQQLCRDQLRTFAKQQQELEQRDKARQKAETTLAELQARQEQVETRLTRAQTAYQQARETLKQARQDEQRIALSRESAQLDQELAEIEGNLSNARELQAQLLQQREQLQANRIDAAQLKKLQKLSRELDDLAIAQQAVATRLQFELLPGQSLQLDSESLTGQGERLLLEPTDLHIAGVGKLRVQPGGEDIADLVRRQQVLQDDITGLLGSLRVENLVQAEERAEQCRTLQEDIRRNELLLNSHAPDGVDELSNRQQLGNQRRQELQALLAGLPESAADKISVTTAETHLETADETLKAAEKAEASFRVELGLASQALQSSNAEWQKLQDEIESPDRQQRERQLNDQLLDLRATETGLETSIGSRQQQIDAANPDILRQDIVRLSRTADAMEKAAQERDKELIRLQTSLETLGAQGLEEQRAELAQELQLVSRRRDEFSRRAAALNLLLELLKAKRQALTRRLQAPLQRHLSRYLQLLFPQASLTVDEDLIPEQLIRTANGTEERGDFAALSFGAREQMGLISRLAYADLLKEAGRPTLIILDDALVHSDPQRLGQMKRILFDAAQRHQILLFTCHPENWRDLGVAPRDMQSLKVSA